MEERTGKAVFGYGMARANGPMGHSLMEIKLKGKVIDMLKKNNARMLALAVALVMMLSGCASAPDQGSVPAAAPAPVETVVPVVPVVPAADAGSPVQDGQSVSGDVPADGTAPVGEDDTDVGNAPVDGQYHRPTEEERRLAKMEMYLDYCRTQATVETDRYACVVDVRTAENPYDVVWDYGQKYDSILGVFDWSLVFDAGYYMEQFPMLAYQYHYDEALLLRHFQTVGVHEGRQGSAGFNVADYMSKCSADVREFYGDCYAAYYFHWMNVETDRGIDVSGKNQPKQMVAVMTAMQSYELQQVNGLRGKLGVEPLIFDSELAAMGNFRAWVDAEEDWQLHEWLHAHKQEAYDMLASFGSTSAGENTVKSYSAFPKNWYDCYYNSKPHYDAMVDGGYAYIGCSNGYLGDCSHKPNGMVMVEFDMFAKDLSTALNP